MPSTVHLLFFASAREAVGRSRLDRPIDGGGVGVGELLAELIREFPRLSPVLASSRLVLNGQYLKGDRGRVRPGDELAIHPPYSGG